MGRLRPDQFTYKQQRFIEEMILDPSNATAAAKRAGYSIDTARQQAHDMLNDPKIKDQIDGINEEAAKRLGITKERILQELAVVAFSNLKHVITQDDLGNTTVNLAGLKDEISGAISELSIQHTKKGKDVKVKMSDKQAALIAIARMMGWDKEKIEVSGKLTLEQLIEQSMVEPIKKDSEE